MDQPNATRDVPARTVDKAESPTNENAQPIPSPGTDPTNPVTQESTGAWVAAGRASDRRNNEPGMTDGERGRRKS
ncbi:MAG TPA: hypothetical protein VN688_22755 [Gemmataceae bacterium]|nr:hypothetical protein [Gemmataceae bacterium]